MLLPPTAELPPNWESRASEPLTHCLAYVQGRSQVRLKHKQRETECACIGVSMYMEGACVIWGVYECVSMYQGCARLTFEVLLSSRYQNLMCRLPAVTK